MELTHINEQGRARMVDVSEKDDTKRIAVGFGKICMKKENSDEDSKSGDKKRGCTGGGSGVGNHGGKTDL